MAGLISNGEMSSPAKKATVTQTKSGIKENFDDGQVTVAHLRPKLGDVHFDTTTWAWLNSKQTLNQAALHISAKTEK
jgi:hypothetical protein